MEGLVGLSAHFDGDDAAGVSASLGRARIELGRGCWSLLSALFWTFGLEVGIRDGWRQRLRSIGNIIAGV